MPGKKEKEFLTTLGHSARAMGAFFHKIGDAPHMGGGARFDIKKPFDVLMIWKGIPVGIEAKYLPDYGAFGMSSLRPNQVEGLDAARAAGAAAFVILNIRKKGEFSRMMWFDWGLWRSIWIDRGNCLGREVVTREQVEAVRQTVRHHPQTQKAIRELRFPLDRFLQAIEDSPRVAFYATPALRTGTPKSAGLTLS